MTREIRDDSELVDLHTKLVLQNSVALDGAITTTGFNEADTVNRAIAIYAAIVAMAEDPRRPTVGVVTGLEEVPAWRRALGRTFGRTVVPVQWGTFSSDQIEDDE